MRQCLRGASPLGPRPRAHHRWDFFPACIDCSLRASVSLCAHSERRKEGRSSNAWKTIYRGGVSALSMSCGTRGLGVHPPASSSAVCTFIARRRTVSRAEDGRRRRFWEGGCKLMVMGGEAKLRALWFWPSTYVSDMAGCGLLGACQCQDEL